MNYTELLKKYIEFGNNNAELYDFPCLPQEIFPQVSL